MRLKVKIIAIILFGLMTACGDMEIKYFTRINPDGSIFKIVEAIGDSAKVFNNPFPFELNSQWQIEYSSIIDSIDGDTLFIASAQRTFSSWAEVQATLYRDVDTLGCENIAAVYSKHFKWFYTYHAYEEVFLKKFPFSNLSIDTFLSPEQYAHLVLGDTTVTENCSEKEKKVFEEQAEEQFFQFLATSVSDEFIRILDNYSNAHGIELDRENLKSEIEQLILSSDDSDIEIDELCQQADILNKSTWIQEAYNAGVFNEFSKSLDHLIFLGDGRTIKTEIEVPGLLYDSNAHVINNNTAEWQFNDNMFQYKDYVTQVKYRTVNLWAIILSVILSMLIVWFIFRFK